MPEKRNASKFNKIRHHLRSTQIDEKLHLLNEIPTNNTTTMYAVEPDKFIVTPAVYREGLNLSADSNPNGTDTSGLFNAAGEILTEQPPGDNSYILGPMVSVYFPDGDYTAIGYIQKDTRQVVNLARLSGSLEDWNGTDGFISYSQLTLAQAVWYWQKYKENKVSDYRIFYIGIFEPIPRSDVTDPSSGVDIDNLGRWLGKIISDPHVLTPALIQKIFTTLKGPDPNLPAGIANQQYAKDLSDLMKNLGTAGQVGARILRALTDDIRYAGDKIVKGLPPGIDYIKDWQGGGKKLVDKLFGSAEKAEKILGKDWYNTDYAAPQGTLRPGEVDVAKMYADPTDTRGVPWGDKTGDLWIGDAPNQGKHGIKNPFGSKVSRGWSGFPEVQISTSGGGVDMARASADDLARLGAQGTKTSKILSRVVPGVAAAAAAADVGIRISRGDYTGAVAGALSAIPGPIGWVAFGAQMGMDALGWSGGNYRKESFIIEDTKDEILKVFNDVGKDRYIRMLASMMLSFGMHPDVVTLVIKAYYNTKLSDDEIKFIKNALPKMLKNLEERSKKYQTNENHLKNHRKVIKEIRKPYYLPEEKKVKIKHRPKVIGMPPRTIGKDLMKQAEVPTSFKPIEEKTWGKHEKHQNTRLSQERKNMILDSIGTSDHAWEWLTEKNQTKSKKIMYGNFDTGKKGKEDNIPKIEYVYNTYKIISKEEICNDYIVRMVDDTGKEVITTQSVLNERLHKEFEQKMLEQQTMQADKDPLFKRVADKLKPIIDYQDKPSKLGYPDTPPPEPIDGWHPEYGQKVDYYKKLDPHSADSMSIPQTDDEKINREVENQTSKNLSLRLKKALKKNK